YAAPVMPWLGCQGPSDVVRDHSDRDSAGGRSGGGAAPGTVRITSRQRLTSARWVPIYSRRAPTSRLRRSISIAWRRDLACASFTAPSACDTSSQTTGLLKTSGATVRAVSIHVLIDRYLSEASCGPSPTSAAAGSRIARSSSSRSSVLVM